MVRVVCALRLDRLLHLPSTYIYTGLAFASLEHARVPLDTMYRLRGLEMISSFVAGLDRGAMPAFAELLLLTMLDCDKLFFLVIMFLSCLRCRSQRVLSRLAFCVAEASN